MDKNASEICENEKSTNKAYKSTVFHLINMQICDVLITILLLVEAPLLRKVAANWGEPYCDLVSFATVFSMSRNAP